MATDIKRDFTGEIRMAGLVPDKAITTGHEYYPPTKVNATINPKVYVQGKKVVVDGDPITPHTRIREEHHTHGGRVISKTNKIYVCGVKAAQIGDPISCGDAIAESSNKVFING